LVEIWSFGCFFLMILKRFLWLLPITFLLASCEQSATVLLPTPEATVTPAATPTCYVVLIQAAETPSP
jgi:hypothetical protein